MIWEQELYIHNNNNNDNNNDNDNDNGNDNDNNNSTNDNNTFLLYMINKCELSTDTRMTSVMSTWGLGQHH